MWLWARAELRRRWTALIVLGLLAGVTGGLATAAVAGARRTDTAWERLRQDTRASDALVFASQAALYRDDELQYDRLAGLPYVKGVGGIGLWYAISSFGPTTGFMTTYGNWLVDVDSPRIIEGRAPDPDDPDEVVISPPQPASALAEAGIGVGDAIDLQLFTRQQIKADTFDHPDGPAVTLQVVGIADGPFNLAAIPSTGDIYAGPAFADRYGHDLASFNNLALRLEDPPRDMPRLEAVVDDLYPGLGVPVYDLSAAGKRVTNGTHLETTGLLLFAAAVVIAGLVIVGQALARSVQAGGGDVPTLVALGFSRDQAALALALPHLVSGAVAIVTTAVTAIALSPRFPIGLGRRVDPDVGLHADLVVVAVGACLVASILAAGVLVTAWRTAASVGRPLWWAPRSRIVMALHRMGAPASVSIGAGLALEPGRGQRALPTRSALAGACAGAIGVIGAMTLAAGIEDATSHAERFGSVWDIEIVSDEAVPDTFSSAIDRLAEDPDIASVARIGRQPIPVGDVVVPFYGIDEVAGSTQFVVLHGRPPRRRGEVVLGPDSASTFGVGIGDPIHIGQAGRFTVVGIGLLPTTPHSSFDQGGWLLPDDIVVATPSSLWTHLRTAFGTSPLADIDLREAIFARGDVVARLTNDAHIETVAARITDEAGGTLSVTPAAQPADQQNLRNVRALPALFAIFLLVLALGALAHVSTSVLRRRRGELAILQALGLTPRQIRSCLAWQATTFVVIGLMTGIPIGLVIGRGIWRLVTNATPMVYAEPVATLTLLLIAPIALLAANLLAAIPGRRASRLHPADVLRTE